jgi:hypothetical protein
MPSEGWQSIARTTLRVLFFRATRVELMALNRRHLAFGMLCVWLVGMGRYWDDPGAKVLQHLGLGSVIYVVVLSAFLWISIRPLGPQAWSYERLLTYVSLVSPPAVLYAIPVERFMSMDLARSVNAWFLAVVAAWRVALWVVYLVRVTALGPIAVTVGSLLPLTGIVTALVALNLERAVFDFMGGMREAPTANDTAYGILLWLSWFSIFAFVPLLFGYVVLIVRRYALRE